MQSLLERLLAGRGGFQVIWDSLVFLFGDKQGWIDTAITTALLAAIFALYVWYKAGKERKHT